jgi:hypothetical protein
MRLPFVFEIIFSHLRASVIEHQGFNVVSNVNTPGKFDSPF